MRFGGEEALEEYARRHGLALADAFDEVVGVYLEWEKGDFEEAAEGVKRGLECAKAGRTRPAKAFLDELGTKHSLSR